MLMALCSCFLLCTVTDMLPVALTPEDFRQNPEFGKLLKALTQHLVPSGASVASQQDVQEVPVFTVSAYLDWFAFFRVAIYCHMLYDISTHSYVG